MPTLLSIWVETHSDSMDDLELQQTVERLLAPLLMDRGAELVEARVSGSRNRRMVRIYVDRPGGITIGECASLSRDLGDLLDIDNPIDGRYVLEVSSPGLDRELKSDQDYRLAQGRSVRLILEGRGVLVGILSGYSDVALTLDVEGEVQTIPRSGIQKANLHFEF